MTAAVNNADSKRFLDMTPLQKLVFLLKLVVFFCTFGYAFPKILSD